VNLLTQKSNKNLGQHRAAHSPRSGYARDAIFDWIEAFLLLRHFRCIPICTVRAVLQAQLSTYSTPGSNIQASSPEFSAGSAAT
jgi:hypothetical protein